MEYVGYATIGVEIAAILAGLWWLGRPEYCFYWSLIAGFFSGMVKIVFGGYLGYVAPEFLTALTLLGTLVYIKSRGQYFIPHMPLSRPFVLLALWCVIELVNPLSPPLRSLLGMRAWLFYLALFFAGYHLVSSAKQIERLYMILFGLGVATGLFGLWQWWAPGDFAMLSDSASGWLSDHSWVRPGDRVRVFRVFSTFVMSGAFGIKMAFVSLITITMLFGKDKAIRSKVGLSIGIGVMLAGLIVSGSRGALVCLMIGIATFILLLRGITKQVVVIAVFSVGLLVVSYTVGDQILGRYQTIIDPQEFFWKWYHPLSHGVRLAIKNPIGEGMGYTASVPKFLYSGSLREEFGTFVIDSGVGSAAAELGLPGLLIFIYLVIQVFYRSIKSWYKLSDGYLKHLLLEPAAFAVIFALSCVIVQPQSSPPMSSYQWYLIGVLMKAPQIVNKKDDSTE